MNFSGLRRWVGLGALAAAALVGAACGEIPRTGGNDPREPRENIFGAPREPIARIQARQLATDRGYNGTIADLGSSIDPRTAEKAGVQGRSLPEDLAWQPAGKRPGEEGVGGSGAEVMRAQQGAGAKSAPSRPEDFLRRLEEGQGSGPDKPNVGSSNLKQWRRLSR